MLGVEEKQEVKLMVEAIRAGLHLALLSLHSGQVSEAKGVLETLQTELDTRFGGQNGAVK